jgi:hypothetical protein
VHVSEIVYAGDNAMLIVLHEFRTQKIQNRIWGKKPTSQQIDYIRDTDTNVSDTNNSHLKIQMYLTQVT